MPRACVVLDANGLMLPFQFRLNLDAELARLLGPCDVRVPSSVRDELSRLAPRDRKARAALLLAERYAGYETSSVGDAGVVEAAEALHASVLTNDRALLALLRKKGIPRISLRSRSHLILEP